MCEDEMHVNLSKYYQTYKKVISIFCTNGTYVNYISIKILSKQEDNKCEEWGGCENYSPKNNTLQITLNECNLDKS